MNKEQVLGKIEAIPLFVLRDAAVKESNVLPDSDQIPGEPQKLLEYWEPAKGWKAVTESDKTQPLVFVSNRYAMVQLRDTCKKIANQLPEFDGNVFYYNGYVILDMFPGDQEFIIDQTGYRIGVTAHNSVNCMSAETIKFCITDGQRKITLPKKMAHFRKVHVGKISQISDDYISTLGKIKEMWSTVCTTFANYKIKLEELDDLAKQFKLDGKSAEYIKTQVMSAKVVNLWDYFMEVFDFIEKKNFKSDIHRARRLDEFVETMFLYKMATTLGR